MGYDRFGRTPHDARRQRIYDWLCVAALGLMVAGIFTCGYRADAFRPRRSKKKQ